MTIPRFAHIAALLPNGKVLISGGSAATAITAELYDPKSGTFTAIGTRISIFSVNYQFDKMRGKP
jgi:hypothetical protein